MKITGQQPPEFHGVKGGTGKDNQKAAEREGTLTGSGEPPVKTSTFVMNKIKSLINKFFKMITSQFFKSPFY